MDIEQELKATKLWLITGVAGFIGSNLLEYLLTHGQKVVGIDNFSTGQRANLEDVKAQVGASWSNFKFVEGDICNLKQCREVMSGVDVVLHQAALGSVPRSIEDPVATHAANVDGFLNISVAARDAKVKRLVYASSSSVYGDLEDSPKQEQRTGQALSPYAASKQINEVYAQVFGRVYNMSLVGLRYFNVFGARQNPHGAYAAVIPRWVEAMLKGEACTIYGDGETSRDFCYIENAVEANIRAALVGKDCLDSSIYNIACGKQTSLNQLYALISAAVSTVKNAKLPAKPKYESFRAGDVRHSLADISVARRNLGYAVSVQVEEGIKRTVDWYVRTSRI